MNKRFEVTERSKRVATLAKLLGYNGDDSKMKDVDAYLGKRYRLAPKSISQIRWKYRFSPGNSAKILKALGEKAQHLEGLSDFLSIDVDGKVLPSLRTGQKAAKKKAAKKAAKGPKTPAVKAPAAAVPTPTPQAVVAQSEPVPVVATKSRAVGGNIVITQVDHGGQRYQAILVPLGSTVSFSGTGPGTMITVE